MIDVALVAMPFGPLFRPSLGLSLLKAGLTRRGVSSRVFHFTIDYAEKAGLRFYKAVAGTRNMGLLAGEWVFGGALFDVAEEDERAYLASLPVSDALAAQLLRERRAAGAFADRCAELVLQERPQIVGLTSTFQQHAAALALAKRIKAASPSTFVVMGGANCEGVMGAETMRQFAFLDAAVSGEGDAVFPELVRRVRAGEPLGGMPGVRTRASIERDFAERRFDTAPPVLDLDELPEPDFDDFMVRYERSRIARRWEPALLFESSRGCWWGEKMHCTFCGLNGATMRFRSKSAPRAVGELQSLARRFPGLRVSVVDNILDLDYFETALPELARLQLGTELFYETKSNLRREQVRMLRASGVLSIQPGIESLSDAILKLMRKGVTALQNIQLLKWCAELGVKPFWNFLGGFPGEPPSEYERMARLLPLLSHLPPPSGAGPIRLDRFSPNFHDAERLGFAEVRPFDAYRHIYPLPAEAVHNLAYFFEYGYREPRDVDAYLRPLQRAADAWKRAHATSALFSVDAGDHLIVWDLRPVARQLLTVLSGLDRRVQLACEAAIGARQLAALLGTDAIASADALCARGIMLRDGERFLALTISLGDYVPSREITTRFHSLVRRAGTRSNGSITVPWDARSPRPPDPRPPVRGLRPLTPSRFAVDGRSVILS